MRQPCFRRIQLWYRFRGNDEKKRKGALTLLTVFLFIVFSTLGLGMLSLTQVYLKISAYRKNTLLLEVASENGIKQGYNHLHDLVSLASSPILITESDTSQFLDDSRTQGNAVVQRVLGCRLPVFLTDRWERLAWESLSDFNLVRLREEPEHFFLEYRARISATGRLQGFNPTKASILDSELGILAGHIPLSAIAFLLDKSMTAEQRRDFLAENRIKMLPTGMVGLPDPVAFSEGGLLPRQALPQLAKALKIKIFHPQDLSAARLRLVLGLDVSDEPVPEGVYLIQDDLGLGGVFVQGDLDELVLAIQENFQIILFRQGQDLWILKFSPEESKTVFVSPDGIQSFDHIPLGIIIVNGKILSLGGGYADAAGNILMADQEEIPCVKRGVSLTFISSDDITLTSHLIYQGVTWKEGVPYIKDADAQLIIHAAGQDFLDGEEEGGEIIIGENTPEKLKIHASMTASGEGFTVMGNDKEIQLLGSLQASNVALNGNEISIKFDNRFLYREDNIFQNGPLTEKPVLYITGFKITEWRENL